MNPNTLNDQLTLNKFLLAIMVVSVIIFAFYNDNPNHYNLNKDLVFQRDEKPINVVPPPTLEDNVNIELYHIALQNNLTPEQFQVIKSISCESLVDDKSMDLNTKMVSLGKSFEVLAEKIQADSIINHGFITPNDEQEVKFWKNLSAKLKDYKYN